MSVACRLTLYLLSVIAIPAVTQPCAHAQNFQRQFSPAENQELSRAVQLKGVALSHFKNAQYADAERLMTSVVKTCERILGPNDPNTADVVSGLGSIHARRGDYAKAEDRLRQALQIREQVSGPNHSATTTIVLELAGTYGQQQKPKSAEPLLKRLLKTYETIHGDQSREVADVHFYLGKCVADQGRYGDAKIHNQSALSLRERAWGPNAEKTADSLRALGMNHYSVGEYLSAKLLIQRALQIYEQTLGSNHHKTAEALVLLGANQYESGNDGEAESLYRRALQIYEQTNGRESIGVATVSNNLAAVYEFQGNYIAAEPLYRKALWIAEKTNGKGHSTTAAYINNLALLNHKQQNYAAAQQLYQNALQTFEKAHGADHPMTANVLNNLAGLYQEQKDYDRALPLYQRALVIRENSLGRENPTTGITVSNMGNIWAARGNDAKAETYWRRSLKINEKTLGTEHPRTLVSYHKLARSYARTDKALESARAFDQGRRSTRKHVAEVLPRLSEREQHLFLRKIYEADFHSALSHPLRFPSEKDASVRLSATWLINGKAVAQEALAQSNLFLRNLTDSKLRPIAKQLLDVRNQLAALAMTMADDIKKQQHIVSLTAQEQRLTRLLGGANTNASDAGEWIELKDIQTALPPTTTFIDFARFNVDTYEGLRDPKQKGTAHYAAWITRGIGEGHANEQVNFVDLGPADSIDALVNRVRSHIEEHAQQGGEIQNSGEIKATELIKKELRQLAEKIWEPLETHLTDVTDVVLSPDGALWLAPWNALAVGQQRQRYLIEQYGLRFVVSGRDLVKTPASFSTNQPAVFADPHFDQTAAEKRVSIEAIFKRLLPADELTTRNFSAKSVLPVVQRLPSTAAEAAAISPMIESFTGKKVILYKERYALECVAKALSKPQLVSFATHGFFLPSQEHPNASGLDDDRATPKDVNGKTIENPLLRCGLLLAGCNGRGSVIGDDDGILTGLEIVGIDLRGTELVVLSACETGIGEINNGEGVAGLRHAFQLAGANAVVASLWQVPDQATAKLMTDFFDQLADESNGEALRNAQLERIKNRRARHKAAHPFYWAAFTMTGQP